MKKFVLSATLVAMALGVLHAQVTPPSALNTYIKDANANNLNLDSSWISPGAPGTAPGSSHWVRIDERMGAARTVSLGEDLSWYGLVFSGDVATSTWYNLTVNTGNTLTLGAGGIRGTDTGLKNALTLNCAVTLAANQQWLFGSGATNTQHVLTLNNTVDFGGYTLNFEGDYLRSHATYFTLGANTRFEGNGTLRLVGTTFNVNTGLGKAQLQGTGGATIILAGQNMTDKRVQVTGGGFALDYYLEAPTTVAPGDNIAEFNYFEIGAGGGRIAGNYSGNGGVIWSSNTNDFDLIYIEGNNTHTGGTIIAGGRGIFVLKNDTALGLGDAWIRASRLSTGTAEDGFDLIRTLANGNVYISGALDLRGVNDLTFTGTVHNGSVSGVNFQLDNFSGKLTLNNIVVGNTGAGGGPDFMVSGGTAANEVEINGVISNITNRNFYHRGLGTMTVNQAYVLDPGGDFDVDKDGKYFEVEVPGTGNYSKAANTLGNGTIYVDRGGTIDYYADHVTTGSLGLNIDHGTLNIYSSEFRAASGTGITVGGLSGLNGKFLEDGTVGKLVIHENAVVSNLGALSIYKKGQLDVHGELTAGITVINSGNGNGGFWGTAVVHDEGVWNVGGVATLHNGSLTVKDGGLATMTTLTVGSATDITMTGTYAGTVIQQSNLTATVTVEGTLEYTNALVNKGSTIIIDGGTLLSKATNSNVQLVVAADATLDFRSGTVTWNGLDDRSARLQLNGKMKVGGEVTVNSGLMITNTSTVSFGYGSKVFVTSDGIGSNRALDFSGNTDTDHWKLELVGNWVLDPLRDEAPIVLFDYSHVDAGGNKVTVSNFNADYVDIYNATLGDMKALGVEIYDNGSGQIMLRGAYAVIPEPSTWLLLGVGAVVMFARRMRRKE